MSSFTPDRKENFSLVACLDFETWWRVQVVGLVSNASSVLELQLNSSRLTMKLKGCITLMEMHSSGIV